MWRNICYRAIPAKPDTMTSSVLQDDLNAVFASIAALPAGASIDALQRMFPQIPRRSLQRRLARLVEDKRLRTEGEGRARRYLVPTAPDMASSSASASDSSNMGMPALWQPSREGKELRTNVGRPLAQRKPIGYQRHFLDDYQPNHTWYLPPSLRDHLHAIGQPPGDKQPAGTYARQIIDRLMVDLSWASSRLEGNTYSRLDTQNLIEFGHAAEGKDRLETQMILNHKAAIDMLVSQADGTGFNRYTLQNLHALLADNLLPNPGAGGRLRRIDVAIVGTVYQPTAVPQTIVECFDTLLAKADAIGDAFEQAFFVMVQLPYLQPFEDVNKRVSRLAANIPLIKRNLAPLSFVDVPQDIYVDGLLAIYELNRIELLRDVFVWAYERSCQRYTLIKQALPEPDPLRLRYREQLSAVIGVIVRNGTRIIPDRIRELAARQVAPQDMDAFVALTINELHQLHEGNIARHRLRPLEFQQWRDTDPLGTPIE
ncbi:MAG: Fic family protein [Rhodanobacter sp.]